MARINLEDFKKKDKGRNTVHTKVKATYTTFEDYGDKYFQIDTYGSNNRENKEVVSQSIQLNEKEARKLVKLLIEYFEILD